MFSFLTFTLGHASVQDRQNYRAQLAIMIVRYPAQRERLLADLDPVERRAVEDIARVQAMLPGPTETDTAGDLCHVEVLPGGGRAVYIGRPDGVYRYEVSAAGGVTELAPYAPWSVWKREHPE
jgi:hypothetical protein